MLAVMVVSPIRPSAYAIPGLRTPRAASRRTDGVQVSGSRRTRATTRRKAQLTASCTGSRVRGATSSTTCLETTVPVPQQRGCGDQGCDRGTRRAGATRRGVDGHEDASRVKVGDSSRR